MLVLSRKVGEVITIGSDIKITVLGIDRGLVRLGIDAPKEISIHREELLDNSSGISQNSAEPDD